MKNSYGLNLLVALVVCSIISWAGTVQLSGSIASDFPAHAEIVKNAAISGNWPVYSFFHLFIGLITLGSEDVDVILTACLVSAVIFSAFRALVVFGYMKRYGVEPMHAMLSVVALAVAMPLLTYWTYPNIYLGQVAINAWHNPTILPAWPLGLIAFLLMMRFLNRPGSLSAALAIGATVLAALAKPNFPLALVPGFLVAATYKFWVERRYIYVIVAGMCCLALAGLAVIQLKSIAAVASESEFILAPFAAWRLYSGNLPVSMAASFAFPIIATLTIWRNARDQGALAMAWLVLVIAVVQAILFAETGDRMYHFNFIWGAMVANFVLFVVCLTELFRQRLTRPVGFTISLFVLGAHVLFGIVYLIRIGLYSTLH